MIEYKDFYYWPTNDNRKLHIYLPQGYYESDEKYPVMYMFDGHNLFHNQQATYGKSWELETFMDNYDKKMIIVGMECSHRGDEKLDEYCPYNKRMFGHTIHGIGEKTFGWIIHNVKPYIDFHYRTYSHREATGIGGSSMGRIMSLYAGLAHSDVFSKCACLSTGIFWNLSNFRKTMKENEICDDTRIYMSWVKWNLVKQHLMEILRVILEKLDLLENSKKNYKKKVVQPISIFNGVVNIVKQIDRNKMIFT